MKFRDQILQVLNREQLPRLTELLSSSSINLTYFQLSTPTILFTMSVTQGDVLTIPAYNQEAESAAVEISWSQSFRTRTARYYIVKAHNQSKENAEVLLYIQDSYYKDPNSNEYVGKLPGARQEGSTYKSSSH